MRQRDEKRAIRDEDGTYPLGQVYASWISGYSYDDAGNLKTDENGEWTETDEPHWIDHIPVGEYVLEETECHDRLCTEKEGEYSDPGNGECQSLQWKMILLLLRSIKRDGKTGRTSAKTAWQLTLYQIARKRKR